MIASTLELENIGAVEHLSIPIPEDGGVVVLKGTNGSGKSTALRAAERLASGREVKIFPRDGTTRGEISGLGVTVRVSRSVTRTGELECESLDGKLSVAELVDPGLKGLEENDARRMRALVQLAGVEPDVDIFRPILSNDEFDAVVKKLKLETDDILVMADRIKRGVDEAARGAEGIANTEQAKAAACRESAKDINVKVETDDATLQAMLESAIRLDTDLKARKRAADARAAEILEARQKICEKTTTDERRVSLQDARDRETYAHNSYSEAMDAEKKIEEALAVARRTRETAKASWDSAMRELQATEQFHSTIAELEEIVQLGELAAPSSDEIVAAEDAIANCRASIEAGVLARRAIEKLAQAKVHAELESAAIKRAETLREAGKRIDDVLSEQIAKLGSPIRVKAGRLVLNTIRGETFFAELSEGERWKMSLDIAIEAVGPGGLLSIPQEAYESLDPINRNLIGEHVKGRGVVILTAEATDGPLRAELQNLSV